MDDKVTVDGKVRAVRQSRRGWRILGRMRRRPPDAGAVTSAPVLSRQLVGARSWAARAWPGVHRQAGDAGPAGLTQTEDRVLANGTVFAVADGASRPGHGGVAATLAIAEFALAVAATSAAYDSRYRVQSAVAQANACVRYYGDHRPYRGMQTTLSAAFVWDGAVIVVSVGDSRIVLIRDGTVLPLLQAQTYGMPRSFIGAGPGVPTMAMDWFLARDGDRIVAMTDGLDCLSAAEIGTFGGCGDPTLAVEALLHASAERSGDDVACVVADLGMFPVVDPWARPPANPPPPYGPTQPYSRPPGGPDDDPNE